MLVEVPRFADASLSCVDIDLLILSTMLTECKACANIPNPEELFARLVVLLHDPLAREQQAAQILTVLCYIAPLFPENINLFLARGDSKMKAYVSDTEDLKQDPSFISRNMG